MEQTLFTFFPMICRRTKNNTNIEMKAGYSSFEPLSSAVTLAAIALALPFGGCTRGCGPAVGSQREVGTGVVLLDREQLRADELAQDEAQVQLHLAQLLCDAALYNDARRAPKAVPAERSEDLAARRQQVTCQRATLRHAPHPDRIGRRQGDERSRVG